MVRGKFTLPAAKNPRTAASFWCTTKSRLHACCFCRLLRNSPPTSWPPPGGPGGARGGCRHFSCGYDGSMCRTLVRAASGYSAVKKHKLPIASLDLFVYLSLARETKTKAPGVQVKYHATCLPFVRRPSYIKERPVLPVLLPSPRCAPCSWKTPNATHRLYTDHQGNRGELRGGAGSIDRGQGGRVCRQPRERRGCGKARAGAGARN